MTLWAVGSKHGSPGATTLGLALTAAWPAISVRPRMLVEADPNGGVLAARFDNRLRLDRTLTDLAVSVRRGWTESSMSTSSRELWDGVPVVVAPPSAEQTRAALHLRSDQLAASLAAADADIVVDVGRIDAASPALPLAQRAVVTVLLSRCALEDALLLQPLVAELFAHDVAPALVLIEGSGGPTDSSPEDVADVAGAPLLGLLPHDARSAGVFAGSAGRSRRLERSLWWRSVRELASVMSTRSPESPLAEVGALPHPARASSSTLDPPPIGSVSNLDAVESRPQASVGSLGAWVASTHRDGTR